MKNAVFHGFVVSLGLFLASSAFASLAGMATYTSTPNGPNYNYTITLTDTGTTNIGTFWFSWIPGQDYMANNPILVNNPTGWTSSVTGGFSGDGYAIQWVNNTNAITPGKSLNFSFTSAETPAQLAGNSQFFNHPPEGTSYIYIGAPETDPGFKFVASPAISSVPEPSSMILAGLAAGAFGLKVWRSRRRKLTASTPTDDDQGNP
jgi:PEP-CTERM motif